MPIELTETPSRDPIIVPAGGDQVSRAALVAAYQALANRVAYLEERAGGILAPARTVIEASSFAPAHVNTTDDARIVRYVNPSWDVTFFGASLSFSSGVTRYAFGDLSKFLPRSPCDVRLVSAKGVTIDDAQVRLTIHRRPANTGSIDINDLGRIIASTAAAAPLTPFNATATPVWTEYQPGDWIAIEARGVMAGTGAAELTSVTIEVVAH
jgi:hypothetical protein